MEKNNSNKRLDAVTDNIIPYGGHEAATRDFIFLHRQDDVRQLALKAAGRKDICLDHALNQIEGWQKARVKLPRWAANDDIVYPPRLSMEQCSSEQTAEYKTAVCSRLCKAVEGDETLTLTDLTGGFAVDFTYMSQAFSRAVYVEQQSNLCHIARHNFTALGITHAEAVNARAEDYLERMNRSTVIFVDPARRDNHGGRTYAVADCTPDVLSLCDVLLDKAEFVVLKLSPMLDIGKTVADFGSCCGEVHVVSAGGECKELLLVLSKRFSGVERVYCVVGNSVMSYEPQEENTLRQCGATSYGHLLQDLLTVVAEPSGVYRPSAAEPLYVCEPDAAIMKAGCFATVARRYGVEEIAANSHLFVSSSEVEAFPGRSFEIIAASTMNKRAVKTLLADIGKANIAVRNFPLKPDELKKRLRLKDGGSDYIFATTAADGTHLLLLCRRVRH